MSRLKAAPANSIIFQGTVDDPFNSIKNKTQLPNLDFFIGEYSTIRQFLSGWEWILLNKPSSSYSEVASVSEWLNITAINCILVDKHEL